MADWNTVIVGPRGIPGGLCQFEGGDFLMAAYSYECGPVFCAEGYAEQVVQLKR